VVIAGLFLITADYLENQSVPMMGLLGTVAGYLLGKGENEMARRTRGTKPVP
jgi:hypothetical protein